MRARPRAYAFVCQMCAELGGDHPDRTMRSYIMQDREAASREAKAAWAAREGWAVVSLQHDGLVIRPPVACTTASDVARRACASLSRACSDALGYEQPVTVKEHSARGFYAKVTFVLPAREGRCPLSQPQEASLAAPAIRP